MDTLHTQNLYKDIQLRTGGEIYIGVVGPVRTGKSTFIKRFMDLLVLPYITDEAEKYVHRMSFPRAQAGRQLPQRSPNSYRRKRPRSR